MSTDSQIPVIGVPHPGDTPTADATTTSSPTDAQVTTSNLPEFSARDLLRLIRAKHPPACTREQLIFFGRENLQYIKQCWEEKLAEATPILERQQEMLELLKDKSVSDLFEAASKYDNPQYKPCKSEWQGESIMPDKSETEAATREVGSTTLNICGWCKFAVAYNLPYCQSIVPNNTRLFRPSCAFLNDEWDHKHEGAFNAPCLLTHSCSTTPSLDKIYRDLKSRHQTYSHYYKNIQQRIAYLDALIAEAESKPLFPEFRHLHHYAQGAPVFFFPDSYSKCPIPHPFGWSLVEPYCLCVRGTLSDYVDYKYTTGSVLMTAAIPSPDDPKPDEPYRITHNSARLISFEEFTYLAEHPDYAQL